MKSEGSSNDAIYLTMSLVGSDFLLSLLSSALSLRMLPSRQEQELFSA